MNFAEKLDLFRLENSQIRLIWPSQSGDYTLGTGKLPLNDLLSIYLLYVKFLLSNSAKNLDASNNIFCPDPQEIEQIKFLLQAEFLTDRLSFANPFGFVYNEKLRDAVSELIKEIKLGYGTEPDSPGAFGKRKLGLLHLLRILDKLTLLFECMDEGDSFGENDESFNRFYQLKEQWNKVSAKAFVFKYCLPMEKSEFLEMVVNKNEGFRLFDDNKGFFTFFW